jgi:hypothetical protein
VPVSRTEKLREMSEEQLTAIAAAGGFPLPLVRAWCSAAWPKELQQWIRTAPAGEVAVWFEANARETDLVEGERRPR